MLYDTRWRPPYGKSEQSLRGGIPPPNALYIIIIYMPAVLRAATETGESHKKRLCRYFAWQSLPLAEKEGFEPSHQFPGLLP